MMKPILSHPSAYMLVYTLEEVERLGEIGLGWVVQLEGVTLHVVLGYLSWSEWR
jgi:hypothetical protein